MKKVHIIQIVLFAIGVVLGSGYRLKGLPSIDERQSQQYCPTNYHNGTVAQDDISLINYDCITICRYIARDPNPNEDIGYILQQQDFTPCATNNVPTEESIEGTSTSSSYIWARHVTTSDQCLNGKCFEGDCVERCKTKAAKEGKTLTGIRIDKTANIVYCDYDGVRYNDGFSFHGQCELPNQLDFYGANNERGYDDDNGQSDVFLTNVVQPDAECKKRFGDGSSAKIWNNGCFFRCNNPQIMARRYIQPNGVTCGDKFSCLFGKCQKNSCIDSCKSASNGENLVDLIQEDNVKDKAECLFKWKTTFETINLDPPSKCEANYPVDQDEDGGGSSESGRSGDGSSEYDTKNPGSRYNAGGNTIINNTNSSANQGIININVNNSHQNIGK